MDSEFLNRQKNDFFRDLTALGSLWAYLILLVFFVVWKDYALAKRLAIGLIVIYAVIMSIRAFYFRERPVKLKHNSFLGRIDASSFPSNHSARIAFVTISLIYHYSNLWFEISALIIGCLVAYSRIFLKKHDLKDVLAGIAVGIAIFLLTYWVK